jgi:hypothetical protein
MDLLKLEIPLSFIEAQLGEPTWRDLLFGLESELLSPGAPIELALKQLTDADVPPAVLELAIANDPHPRDVLDFVRQMAASEPADGAVKER